MAGKLAGRVLMAGMGPAQVAPRTDGAGPNGPVDWQDPAAPPGGPVACVLSLAQAEALLTAGVSAHAGVPPPTLPDRPEMVRAFQKLKTVDLGLLTRGILRHLLARDTAADLAVATRVVEGTLAGPAVSPRTAKLHWTVLVPRRRRNSKG